MLQAVFVIFYQGFNMTICKETLNPNIGFNGWSVDLKKRKFCKRFKENLSKQIVGILLKNQ